MLFVRKVLKLDKLGDNLDVKIPKRDWLKFSIILLLIFLYILHLILSYSESSYWLYGYANFSLTIFLYIGNYTMQSYIVLKLVTKGIGIRYVPSLLFWTFCMVTAIIEAIVIEVTYLLYRNLVPRTTMVPSCFKLSWLFLILLSLSPAWCSTKWGMCQTFLVLLLWDRNPQER